MLIHKNGLGSIKLRPTRPAFSEALGATPYGPPKCQALPDPKIWTKGGFFSESSIHFLNLQEKLFQKTILSLKFKFPANYSILINCPL